MSFSPAINNIFEYIDSLNVMVLSTSGIDETKPQKCNNNIANDPANTACIKTIETNKKNNATNALRSTPVFFARKNNSFYFISVARTIHAQNISQNPDISAAITQNFYNYRDIKGVQIFGCCREIEGLIKIAQAALIYFSKFSDLKSFMQPDLIKSTIGIKWYELTAEKLIYTDNTIRFGYKEEVMLL